jgi:indolepyruvate ferredoxin oxidoreductase
VAAAGRQRVSFINATRIATALTGNAIAANMFVLGYAYQKGAIPLSGAAIARAITGTRWNGWVFFGIRRAGA